MMTGDDKKTKAVPGPKKEVLAENKSAPDAASSKAEGGGGTETPAGYSRGEGQKPVSKAYKENWNAIFAKKKKR
jgi:hypothetical protein